MPFFYDYEELHERSDGDLLAFGEALGVEPITPFSRQVLMSRVVKALIDQKIVGMIEVKGILEILPPQFGFLRVASVDNAGGYRASDDDIYISRNIIKSLKLKDGDHIAGGILNKPRNDKNPAIGRVTGVNYKSFYEYKQVLDLADKPHVPHADPDTVFPKDGLVDPDLEKTVKFRGDTPPSEPAPKRTIAHSPANGSVSTAANAGKLLGGKPVDRMTREEAGEAFEGLRAIYPKQRLRLERDPALAYDVGVGRMIDLMAPIGRGQRALIIAPPKAGKTTILKEIALGISENEPDTEVFVLLIDERPEEVTDFEDNVDGVTIVSSAFDLPPAHHIQVTEDLIARAKEKVVKENKDVVILMDSITRLARAYNDTARNSGRIMSGGIDSSIFEKSKKIFGSARNIKDGGSLTIVSTALIGTENRADEIFYNNFKGTGNCDIYLDQNIANNGIYPAIDVMKSSTRNDDMMVGREHSLLIKRLRQSLAGLTPVMAAGAMVKLVSRQSVPETIEHYTDEMFISILNEPLDNEISLNKKINPVVSIGRNRNNPQQVVVEKKSSRFRIDKKFRS